MTRPLRRGLIGLTSLALAAGGAGLLPSGPAMAAPAADATAVTGASFTWDLNQETTSGAFAPGTWNLMSAGKVGDPGAGGTSLTTASNGQTWSNGKPAGWSATSGDVTVEDLQAGGSYAPATFAGTRTSSTGATANTNGVRGETRLRFADGVGTVDPDAGTASLRWDGDATLLAYSGMTFFYLSDPALTVAADGTGTVKATVGGYATSMDDPTKWDALPDTTVTVATLTGVDVTDTGITTPPAYRSVAYEAPAGATAQSRTSATWGSFPQDFVDVQQRVGQGSYWYSSGGSADPRKVATPLSVGYDVAPTPATPQVTVSRTTLLPSGVQEVTVEGTGFDPAAATATRPPLAGRSGGVYVAVGAFAPTWRPSQGAPSTSRKTTAVKWAVPAADMATIGGADRGAVELTPQGTFSTTLTVDKAALDAATAADPTLTGYGIYTYPGSGATNAAFETATPLAFAAATPRVTVSVPRRSFGQAGTAVVGVTASTPDGTAVPATGSVTLTRAGTTVGTADLVAGSATFALGRLGAGRHALTVAYSGATPDVAAGSGSVVATVAKASTATRPTVVRAPTLRKAGRVKVAVSSPTTAPTGRVTVQVRRTGGGLVKKTTLTLVRGTAAVAVPKGPRGAYRVVARYTGTADVAASSRTVGYRVR